MVIQYRHDQSRVQYISTAGGITSAACAATPKSPLDRAWGMQEWFHSEGVLETCLPLLSSSDSMARLKGLLLASSMVTGNQAALTTFCKQPQAITSVLNLVRSKTCVLTDTLACLPLTRKTCIRRCSVNMTYS